MSSSSSRPDHLLRYTGLVAGHVRVADRATTSAVMALTVYGVSCADHPLAGNVGVETRGVLHRIETVLRNVQRVGRAFIAADGSGAAVATVDNQAFAAALAAGLGRSSHHPDHESGWRHEMEGSHRFGPAALSAEAEGFAGAESSGWWGRDGDGWGAGFTAFAGTRGDVEGGVEAGVFSGSANAHASVGAEAAADGTIQITRDQVGIDAEAGVFVGAKASASAEAEAMGVGYKAGAEGRVGFGADGSADIDVGWEEVGFEVSGGLAFIVGAGGEAGVTFNPKETSNDLVRLGFDSHKKLEAAVTEARHDIEDEIVEMVEQAPARLGDVLDDGMDLLTEPGQIVQNPLSRFGTGTVSSPFGPAVTQTGG